MTGCEHDEDDDDGASCANYDDGDSGGDDCWNDED